MADRDEARRALLDILNRIEELQIDRLLIAFTTDTGQIAFGGSRLDSISVIGLAEQVKAMAMSKQKEFTPFANLTGAVSKPS